SAKRHEECRIAPGTRVCVPHSNFKQPHFRILAAQSVRGLPVPRATCARGWIGGRRQDACEAPSEAGLTYPPRAARRLRAPKARRSASQRSTNHQAIDRSGAPRSGQLSLCPLEGSLLESGPLSDRTSNIYRIVGIRSIGIFRFPRIIFRRPNEGGERLRIEREISD